MKVIQDTIAELELGSMTTYGNLTLLALLSSRAIEPEYWTLDEALERGCEVTEVSPEGAVSELLFTNNCDRPVLLLDGEALVGAKQDRILNLSILAPAGKKIRIPVSCVESGRWSARSRSFKTTQHTHHASGRAQRNKDVNMLLCDTGQPSSNQSAVWADLSAFSNRLGAASPTGAMKDIYKRHDASLENYVDAFAPADTQAGAVFAVAGQIVGMDLFDSAETFRKLLPKLVRSYGLNALEAPRSPFLNPTREAAKKWLRAVSRADASVYPAVGLGEDVRLQSEEITGSALVFDGRVVHACAFPAKSEDKR